MGIFSDNRLHTPAMDSRKLKDGPLKRYKSGLLGSKWKDCYAVLYSDSTLSWYDERGDSRPVGSVFLKDVVPYICVGILTDRMPIRRPSLPTGASVHHLVAIGMDPRAEKVHWLLFGSDADLESWFGEIVKTLPKPASPQPNAPPSGPPPPGFNPSAAPSNDFKPPPVYPPAPGVVANNSGYGGPPPYSGPSGNYPGPQTAYGGGGNYPPPNSGGFSGPGSNYQPGGYAQQPGPTTVIIDRDRGGYGGRSSSGFGGGGLGLGTGLLGGALLGYGLGSFFQPHYHSGFGGFGGGFGGGYPGVGGGYVSDNDTTINNYYNTTNNDTTTNTYTNDNVTSPEQNDFGGGSGFDNMNDYNDYDGAGGDFGSGGDFGGGMDDIGGGDFGGADFGDF